MYDPGTHCGQVGQPSPLPARRTSPPVTTISTSTTRLAIRTLGSHAERVCTGGVARGRAGAAVTASRVRGRAACDGCGSVAPPEEPAREGGGHNGPHGQHDPVAQPDLSGGEGA